MNMQTEPLRLPAWTAAVAFLALPAVVAYLLGQDWKVALAASLAGLIPATATVSYAESKRAFTNSPATVQATYEAAVARATEPGDVAGLVVGQGTIVTEQTTETTVESSDGDIDEPESLPWHED